MILIDAYPEGEYTFQNVGVDDYFPVDIRLENTCIPVDITGHCLSQRQIRTVIPADGTDSNRLWKSRAVSAANPV